MSVWVGCLAMIVMLPFARQSFLKLGTLSGFAACLPVAAFAGYLFLRIAKKRAASYRCGTCHKRWRETA